MIDNGKKWQRIIGIIGKNKDEYKIFVHIYALLRAYWVDVRNNSKDEKKIILVRPIRWSEHFIIIFDTEKMFI